jgi:hypothetical protein
MMKQGVVVPRSSAGIKKEKIRTWWFLQSFRKAITMPPILHTSVQLELGDLFINQFHSREHGALVLQVWLLVADGSSRNHSYRWKQVRDKVYLTLSVLLSCLTLE